VGASIGAGSAGKRSVIAKRIFITPTVYDGGQQSCHGQKVTAVQWAQRRPNGNHIIIFALISGAP